jgi:sulfur carrier protein
MNLTVNGKPATIEGKSALTINDLLAELKVQQADYVSVELNGEIIERDTFGTSNVKDGDVIEFLYFMGGGAD